MSTKQNEISVKWAVAILGVVVAIAGASAAALPLRYENKVTDFESCQSAGGAILETYPEQCMINNVSYTNRSQPHPEYPEPEVGSGDYVGLTEEGALARARKENTPARVVERDGESLPTTMDYVYGRKNLYIKEGTVYKVEIEGQVTDTPSVTE